MIVDTALNSHSITGKDPVSSQGLNSLADKFQESMKSNEAYLHEGREEFTGKNGSEQKMPEATSRFFDMAIANETNPQVVEQLKTMKSMSEQNYSDVAKIFSERTESFGKKMQIEFGLSAIKKSASSIQQLLSAS